MLEFLDKVIKILVILWVISVCKQMGIKPEEVGQALKNFNASFGPALPDANRKKQ